MKKNTGIIIGLVALVAIVGGIYVSSNSRDSEMAVKEQMEKQSMENQNTADEKAVAEEKDTMMKDDTTKDDSIVKTDEMDKKEVVAKAGSYEAYNANKLALAESGDVVLFFHASWCPSCRGLNTSIENNLSSIPQNVTILKTDYDKETELKKKYGVTYQHTLVQVDKDGNMIKKWSGGSTLNNLLSQIQ